MTIRTLILAACVAAASAFQLNSAPGRLSQSRVQQAPQMALKPPAAVGSLLAAMALATANPTLTAHAVEPPAVVQQYGASMVADADSDLRDAQKRFLEERAKIKQEYDTDTDSTFINADEVEGKKSIYVTLVAGLIVVAFVAPMLQFFYYTGGD